jgi:ABC-type nitrate/sulfonate/bicarbonate transport system ATPase subunit
MATLELTNVVKSFDKTTIIHGLDLKVADGEFVVFVGPSGCGKSTLLRIISGWSRPAVARSRSTACVSTRSRRRTGAAPWCFSRMRCTRT